MWEKRLFVLSSGAGLKALLSWGLRGVSFVSVLAQLLEGPFPSDPLSLWRHLRGFWSFFLSLVLSVFYLHLCISVVSLTVSIFWFFFFLLSYLNFLSFLVSLFPFSSLPSPSPASLGSQILPLPETPSVSAMSPLTIW